MHVHDNIDKNKTYFLKERISTDITCSSHSTPMQAPCCQVRQTSHWTEDCTNSKYRNLIDPDSSFWRGTTWTIMPSPSGWWQRQLTTSSSSIAWEKISYCCPWFCIVCIFDQKTKKSQVFKPGLPPLCLGCPPPQECRVEIVVAEILVFYHLFNFELLAISVELETAINAHKTVHILIIITWARLLESL